MAGHADLKKRNVVRKMLRVTRWQQASDLAVSRSAGVSRYLVADVRRGMIGAGSHPPLCAAERPCDPRPTPEYRPGHGCRGGYVYDSRGRAVRESEWLRRRAERIGGRVGRAVLALLDELAAIGRAPVTSSPARTRTVGR